LRAEQTVLGIRVARYEKDFNIAKTMERQIVADALCIVTMMKLLIAISMFTLVVIGLAQEPAAVGKGVYTQKLSNSKVRVFEIHFRPGQRIGVHQHPDHVFYAIEGGTLKIAENGKAPVTMKVKAGDCVFLPAQKHWAQNIGKTHIRGVVFEIKN
jgi:beta-alanine degradation protein BauB